MGKRIVIIGAGSTNFGLKIIGDFYKSQILIGSTIVLHDIRPEAVEKTRKIAENYKEKLQVDFQIEATTSREEALKGADFCLISIEVGNRFELWEQDWGVPVEYGFKQIYGENGGPGGLFHALRIIPVIIEICEDIEKICPNAVVFNYSNPMQRICHALTTKFQNLNIIGLCNEIHSMERQLPTLLDTNLDNIEFEAGGLNHFSILLDVKYKDSKKDGYPIIRDKFNSYYSNLINDHEGFESDPGAERGVFFELFKKYSYLPITTDSHVGEYMQWAFSVADHEGISDFYKKYKNRCLNFYEDDFLYGRFFDNSKPKLDERVVPIIESIIEDDNRLEHAVNIPNNNFIEYLPNDIVVEVPAVINKKGANGKKLDNYPKTFGALLNSQTGVIQLTTEAILNKSKHGAYLALLSDPIVDDAIKAEKLLNTMINKQSKFLGYLN